MTMIEELQSGSRLSLFEQLAEEGKDLLIEELWDAPKALLAAMAQKVTKKNILILTGASKEESRLYHDFKFFTDCPILDFPAWETLPSESLPPSPDIVGERYKILGQIKNNGQPKIILSSLQAALQRLIPPDVYDTMYTHLSRGMNHSFDGLLKKLNGMGYRRCPVAADKGEYAVRGGLIDIYPVSSPDPYRIDFWGDDIDEIRRYDPVSQKSVAPAKEVAITPAHELELLKKFDTLATLTDYLGKNTIVIFDDLLALEDKYVSMLNIPGTVSKTFCAMEEFLGKTSSLQKIYLSNTPVQELCQTPITDEGSLSIDMFSQTLPCTQWRHSFATVMDYLRPFDMSPDEELSGDELLMTLAEGDKEYLDLRFLVENESDETHLKEQLQELDIPLPKKTTFLRGYLSTGFALGDTDILYFPLTEVTKRYKIRRQKQRSAYHSVPSEVFQLVPGESVVHLHHGIGRYLGVERRPNHLGNETEFFLIEYAKKSTLFVPFAQAHLITKYVGSKEESSKLHTLGSSKWKRTKELTEKSIMGYSSELLNIYAKREIHGGYIYPEDGDDQKLFEMEFPFVESEDQLQAIRDIKNDMQSTKCMDRLVCGDVGYGKTEVAMRAAFKAVVEGGKQVALLIPTTILATQHYENFCQRMANWPIKIALLSRIRNSKQVKETLEKVEKGEIDILVGTHRIISNDVKFKRLGLVIIDEEQRFGVRAKEILKKSKEGVDCLTLSATPIPRTLHMSFLGARDMSVISTPPQDRLPIKTAVVEKQDNITKNAILREMNRDGQIFFIHNRVETIHHTAEQLQKLIPNAKIVIAHGQMPPDHVDKVFHTFKNGEADILVATTIVESGIDIPNANTILIDRADCFGMADLYQLRGRVGRWNRRAYAYFLVPRNQVLKEVSAQRLKALLDAGGYGGGMRVAMRDLEIRGAGDILDTKQSGHIPSVGFYLYCKLLKRTIQALQGKAPKVLSDPKIEFPFDARLPREYINEETLRLEFYQRLGDALSNEKAEEILAEMKDRFGEPPEPVMWLYHVTRIRIFAAHNAFTLLKIEGMFMQVEQKKGKTTTSSKKVVGMIEDPQTLEERLVKILKEMQ